MAAVSKRKASAQFESVLEGDDVPAPSPEERRREHEQALLAETHALRAKLNQYITERAAELKAGRDGAGLPIQFLEQELRRGECLCRCAARLLGDPTA